MRLVIFHTELSPYFIECLRQLVRDYKVEILMYIWPPHSTAPFDFGSLDWVGTTVSRRSTAYPDMYRCAREFAPDAILTCGWVDRNYTKACMQFRKIGVPVIAGCDTQFNGSWRQHLAAIIAPFHVRRAFDVIWATGDRQKMLARHLGFSDERIWQGYYSCNWDQYAAMYRDETPSPSFLFVGRLVEVKGISVLAAAYQEYRARVSAPWPLVIGGTGKLESVLKSVGATLLGFVQPDRLPDLMGRSRVFILPSIFEPWGVVLHEAAAAGMPLVCSDACGAGDYFLRNGRNGYLVSSGSVSELRDALLACHELPAERLAEYRAQSHALSRQFTPRVWAQTLVAGVNQLKNQRVHSTPPQELYSNR